MEVIESLPSTDELLTDVSMERLDLSRQTEILMIAENLENWDTFLDDFGQEN